jgi:hypothetical protein
VSDASYLHLGLYSKSAFPDFLNSVLYLSGGKADDLSELRIPDILGRIFLHAQMVTLSANERYVSDFKNTGESMGLAQAFLYAGAQTVVSTLWAVPDIVYFFFMEKFYHGLSQGLRPAMALQEAQHEMRKMTVGEIRQRVLQQQKLLPEAQGKWLKELGVYLEGKKNTLSKEERPEIFATLLCFRELIAAGMEDFKLELKDFIRPEGKREITEENLFSRADNYPFDHPFYWGGFFCMGAGLTKSVRQPWEEAEEGSTSVYIDELALSEATEDIQEALSVLTEEGIKAYETVTSVSQGKNIVSKGIALTAAKKYGAFCRVKVERQDALIAIRKFVSLANQPPLTM